MKHFLLSFSLLLSLDAFADDSTVSVREGVKSFSATIVEKLDKVGDLKRTLIQKTVRKALNLGIKRLQNLDEVEFKDRVTALADRLEGTYFVRTVIDKVPGGLATKLLEGLELVPFDTVDTQSVIKWLRGLQKDDLEDRLGTVARGLDQLVLVEDARSFLLAPWYALAIVGVLLVGLVTLPIWATFIPGLASLYVFATVWYHLAHFSLGN